MNQNIAKLDPEKRVKFHKLEIEVEAAKDRLNAYKEELAADEAPVKPGDVTRVTGYAWMGFNMEVEHVELDCRRWQSGVLVWRATGKILKANGKPGLHTGEATWRIE
jgi:hypothetical protein